MTRARYYKLQDILPNSFDLDAPVEIEKGALYLDLRTKNILLQLRMNVLSCDNADISSVVLLITPMDETTQEIPGLKPYHFIFRDIFLSSQKTFGQKEPIILDNRVRRVFVELQKINFTDGRFWEATKMKIVPPEQGLITSLNGVLQEQLKREIDKIDLINGDRVNYLPEKLENYWLCTCGRPNSYAKEKCVRCCSEKVMIFKVVDIEYLSKALSGYKKKLETKVNRKRYATRVGIFSVVGIAVVAILFFYILVPFLRYRHASALVEGVKFDRKLYDEAKEIFSELGDYKNSPEYLLEINYKYTLSFLNDEKIEDAIILFQDVADYGDSFELQSLTETMYQKAIDLLEKEQKKEAVKILISLGDYKDSEELFIESTKWAIDADLRNYSYNFNEFIVIDINVETGFEGESIQLSILCDGSNWEFGPKIIENVIVGKNIHKQYNIGAAENGEGNCKIYNDLTGELLETLIFQIAR